MTGIASIVCLASGELMPSYDCNDEDAYFMENQYSDLMDESVGSSLASDDSVVSPTVVKSLGSCRKTAAGSSRARSNSSSSVSPSLFISQLFNSLQSLISFMYAVVMGSQC